MDARAATQSRAAKQYVDQHNDRVSVGQCPIHLNHDEIWISRYFLYEGDIKRTSVELSLNCSLVRDPSVMRSEGSKLTTSRPMRSA
eukprot:SAG11_NODE_895_length_6641_cov_6.653928_3_plen_86_part_00